MTPKVAVVRDSVGTFRTLTSWLVAFNLPPRVGLDVSTNHE